MPCTGNPTDFYDVDYNDEALLFKLPRETSGVGGAPSSGVQQYRFQFSRVYGPQAS